MRWFTEARRSARVRMIEASEWPTGPRDVRLAPNEVHLWRIPLAVDATLVAERERLLAEDERERMRRFRFELHQRRFAVRRGALRLVLGRYLGIAPREVRFHCSPLGKPEAEQGSAEGDLVVRFNLSDSSEWALLGVTLGARIGVDIEEVRSLPDADMLARDHFSDREYGEYEGLAASARLAGFYNAWTRKEAWLKATGDGLAAPLRDFDVTLRPADPPRLLRVANRPDEAARWSLSAYAPAAGYIAAVAVERDGGRTVSMTFGP